MVATSPQDDHLDLLMLDRAFLRGPLECLVSSVRSLHKTCDIDTARLISFIQRQFARAVATDPSTANGAKFEKSSVLPVIPSPLSASVMSSEEVALISSGLTDNDQRRCSGLDGLEKLSFSFECPHDRDVYPDVVNLQQQPTWPSLSKENTILANVVQVTNSSKPNSFSSDISMSNIRGVDCDLVTRIAALEDLERRYHETIQSATKAAEFTEKMKTKIQSHFAEIDKFFDRCEYRLNLVSSNDFDEWPSPKSITEASSSSVDSTTIPPLLIRKAAHPKMSNSQISKSSSIVTGRRSVFTQMTTRIDVLIHDYLCRLGLLQTSKKLQEHLNMEKLVDYEIFDSGNAVITALKRHDASPALTWCATHKFKLRKLQNSLEIQLRLQETISLISRGRSQEAMQYLRTRITSNDALTHPDIRPVLALLAFVDTQNNNGNNIAWVPSSYQSLFDSKRWDALVDAFKLSMGAVFELCCRPPLEIFLQSGFSTLKTKSCSEAFSTSCPTCDPLWRSSLKNIPTPHHIRSYIVCPVKGHVMGENDPPLASPDGLVFSTSAVDELTRGTSDGKVECPCTRNRYLPNCFHRLYIS